MIASCSSSTHYLVCVECRAAKPPGSFGEQSRTCRVCDLVAAAPLTDPSRRAVIGAAYQRLGIRIIIDAAKIKGMGIWLKTSSLQSKR